MTAPKSNSKPLVAPGMVIRGVGWMSSPVFLLPTGATTPVRIVKRGGKEIEVKGEYYVQVAAKTIPSCYSCVARPTGPKAKLCDVICPYCAPGHVFATKVIR